MPTAPAAYSRSFLEKGLETLRPSLLAHAISSLPREDALDCVQDTVTAALASWHTFDPTRPDSSLANWLHAILRNRISFCYRARKREANALECWLELDAEAARACQSSAALMSQIRILIRYAPLTERQEDCLFAWLDREPGKATAERLGITPSAVTRHRQAAIAHLSQVPPTVLRAEDAGPFEATFQFCARVSRYFPLAPKLGARLWRERQARLR